MTTRTRRTAEQIANDLEARARVARTKAKNMERALQTRRAIIAGIAIEGMAAAGDADARSVWSKMLAGLKRKQDRLAFGLEPLPDPAPDDRQPVNPPVVVPPAADPVEAAVARRNQAVAAWNAEKSEKNRIGLGQAIAAYEKLTGKLWEDLPTIERIGWGLSDRPGELL